MKRFARIDKNTNAVVNISVADSDWVYESDQAYDTIVDDTAEVDVGYILNDGVYSPPELSEKNRLQIEMGNVEVAEAVEQIYDALIDPSKILKPDVLDALRLKKELREQVT